MTTTTTTPLADEYRDAPIYWLVRLLTAREHEDHESGASAIRELRRLGIDIKFRRRPQTAKGGPR